MIPKILLRKQFQNGYVVRNAEKTAAALAKRCGISKWHYMPQDLNGPSTCIALAWAGDTMLELIEGNPKVESLYTAWIPEADDAARLHHFGFWIHSDEELKQAKAEFDAMGAKDVFSGDFGDILSFHYADTVPMLGHMCELIYLKPAGKDMFAPVPRN